MKLKDYLNKAQKSDPIVAFGYYFNGDRDESADIEDFAITEQNLFLENLTFSLDTEGTVTSEGFTFDYEGDTISLEAMR